uniref:Uncharacterized protein n=1 Tax=Arundo donax TaxID=35708 RepID=A0A0A9CNY3_ARUDO
MMFGPSISNVSNRSDSPLFATNVCMIIVTARDKDMARMWKQCLRSWSLIRQIACAG